MKVVLIVNIASMGLVLGTKQANAQNGFVQTISHKKRGET